VGRLLLAVERSTQLSVPAWAGRLEVTESTVRRHLAKAKRAAKGERARKVAAIERDRHRLERLAKRVAQFEGIRASELLLNLAVKTEPAEVPRGDGHATMNGGNGTAHDFSV
jgi:DeoR/GlpR family transcriptional regulator of sugar metabolism